MTPVSSSGTQRPTVRKDLCNRQDTGRLTGSRALLEHPWCLNLAQRIRSDPRLSSVWPAASRAVLCTYFEKSPVRNWLVALHQDLSIPVAERTEAPGYSGWSEKDGRLFVQPPLEVLQQSVAARVHLDGSDEETGALKVVPRSHTLGRLRPQKAFTARRAHSEQSVAVPRGGLMLMRPLLTARLVQGDWQCPATCSPFPVRPVTSARRSAMAPACSKPKALTNAYSPVDSKRPRVLSPEANHRSGTNPNPALIISIAFL